jgi:hypothetical protein
MYLFVTYYRTCTQSFNSFERTSESYFSLALSILNILIDEKNLVTRT